MIRAALAATAATLAAIAAPPPTAALPPTYVVTTLNVKHTIGPAHARADLHRAQTGSDLVVTEEMGSRHASRFTRPGFRSVQPGDVGEVAIYYRPARFTYRGSFPILLHRSHLFGSATRYALAARFDAGRSCVLVIGVHFVPHIERAGHPRHLPRISLVTRALTRLAATIRFARTGRCGVIVGGDWNVDGYADARVRDPRFPFARLTAVGLRSEWSTFPHGAPTLGRRHVDGFYTDGIRTLSRRTIGRTYSDHNGDRLTFRISR